MIVLAALACVNAFFVAQGDTWLTVDPFSGTVTRAPLSTPVNALADVGGVVYGLAEDRVVTVSPTGIVAVQGNTPARIAGAYAATAVDGQWVIGTGDAVVSVEVPSLRVVADTKLSVPVRAGDLDYWDGSLYALADTSPATLVRIAPDTGAVTPLGSLDGAPPGGEFGAVSIDGLGVMHALHNETGRFFAVPLAEPAAYTVTESDVTGLRTDAATCPSLVDHGDAPTSYGSAVHVVVGDLAIGTSATANDGLSAEVVLASSAKTLRLNVSVRNATQRTALLAGWHDLDRDGEFSPGELAAVPVPPGVRSAVLQWPSIAVRPGPAALRLRLFDGVPVDPPPAGDAVGGEVEDYLITVSAPPPRARRVTRPPATRPVQSRAPSPSPSSTPASPTPVTRAHRVVRPPVPVRLPARRTPLTWAMFIGLIVPAVIVAARARR